MDKIRLCIDCANSRMAGGHPSCHDKRNLVVSLVDGRERGRFECEYLRSQRELCGMDAAWFIPRDKRENAA